MGLEFPIYPERKGTVDMYKAMLDMDGVLADFMKAICKAHNRPNPYVNNPSAYSEFNTEKVWGITPEEFWAPIQGESLDFWAGIDKTPEADRIVRLVCREFGMDNVAILTAPSRDVGSVPGKRAWMDKHYPRLAKNMIFTSAKGFLAGPKRILIDDRDRNVVEFKQAGGDAILFPRLWNSSWMHDGEGMKILERELAKGRRL
jgi:5'(3')-deoxyribonucleotidase